MMQTSGTKQILGFEIWFDQIPKGTAQQKKFGHGYVYESKNVRETRKLYQERLQPIAPENPMTGPVNLDIEFDYVIKDKKRKGLWKTTRPDLDNVSKLFIDELMKCGFFVDDSQIVRLTLSKRFSEDDRAGIRVLISEE